MPSGKTGRTWLEFTCDNCGKQYKKGKGEEHAKRPPLHRFCCVECRYKWQETNTPPNNGQFMAGRKSTHKSPIGSVSLRKDRGDENRLRAWVKVKDEGKNDWQLRANVNWEKEHGLLPNGCFLHHKDRNRLNDEPHNLTPMTREEHAKEHNSDLLAARLELYKHLGEKK